MLWYKGWLETRYRLVLLAVIVAIMLTLQRYSLQNLEMRADAKEFMVTLSSMLSMLAVLVFILLAGAGIVTQSLYATKGLHGSMQYTLALPASRYRMILVRAGLGWIEGVVAIAMICGTIWMLYPALRAAVTPVEMVEYAGTLIVCSSAFYFLAVLLATFLDDQGRAFGSIFLILVFWWLSLIKRAPAVIDLFRATGRDSLLITHVVAWGPIGFSIVLSVALFIAALSVAKTREY